MWSARSRGLAFAFAAPFWAALFLIPYKAAVERADRGSVLATMLLCAGVFNLVVAIILEGRATFRVDPITALTAALLAVATVLGNTGVAMALPSVGPGMTSVLMKAQVLITPVLSIWLLREVPSRRLWVGAGLAMVGFVVPQLMAGVHGDKVQGYLWALMAAVGFSAMQVLTRKVILRIRTAPVNALRLAIAVTALLLLPKEWGGGRLDLDLDTWKLAALAGVLGPGISRLCLMSALKSITPSTTALVSLVGPLFAFLLGGLFFDLVPTRYEALGAVLILFGVLWPMLERPTRPPAVA